MNKLNPFTTGIAAAITLAVLYSLCALAFGLFPDGTLAFVDAWFHGLDLSRLQPEGGELWTAWDFAYGLLGVSGTGLVAGFVFATVSNLLER